MVEGMDCTSRCRWPRKNRQSITAKTTVNDLLAKVAEKFEVAKEEQELALA